MTRVERCADDGNINHDIGQNSLTAAAVPRLLTPAVGRPAGPATVALGCLRGQDERQTGRDGSGRRYCWPP